MYICDCKSDNFSFRGSLHLSSLVDVFFQFTALLLYVLETNHFFVDIAILV